jgi:hypothetical protein
MTRNGFAGFPCTAVGRWAGVALLGLVLAASCGDSSESSHATGGKAGKGGKASVGGRAGKGGASSSSSGGTTAANAGHEAGGLTGESGAGGGGTEPAARCGDGVTQTGEECDDGNESGADDCYQCKDTTACTACWSSEASGCGIGDAQAEVEPRCFRADDPEHGGKLSPANAISQPKTPFATQCSALYACAKKNGCENALDLAADCWCGRKDHDITTCTARNAAGPCRHELDAAAYFSSSDEGAQKLAAILTDPSYPVGLVGLLLNCQSGAEAGTCRDACYPTTPGGAGN